AGSTRTPPTPRPAPHRCIRCSTIWAPRWGSTISPPSGGWPDGLPWSLAACWSWWSIWRCPATCGADSWTSPAALLNIDCHNKHGTLRNDVQGSQRHPARGCNSKETGLPIATLPPDTRLLLIDDHQIHLDGLTLTLNRLCQGITLDHARTAGEAMEQVSRHTYDLILLDLHLPDGNGLHLL